jgi:hypothetical protein
LIYDAPEVQPTTKRRRKDKEEKKEIKLEMGRRWSK